MMRSWPSEEEEKIVLQSRGQDSNLRNNSGTTCIAWHRIPSVKNIVLAGGVQPPALTAELPRDKSPANRQDGASEEGDEKLLLRPAKSAYLLPNP